MNIIKSHEEKLASNFDVTVANCGTAVKRVNKSTEHNYVTLHEIIYAKHSTGLSQSEGWALLCQSVKALQDVLLAGTPSHAHILPLVTPFSLCITSRGRVALQLTSIDQINHKNAELKQSRYLSPEFLKDGRHKMSFSESDIEKMWIYSLGVTLRENMPFCGAADNIENECIDKRLNNLMGSVVSAKQLAAASANNVDGIWKHDAGGCTDFMSTNTAAAVASVLQTNNNQYVNEDTDRSKLVSATSTLPSLEHTLYTMCDPNLKKRACLMHLLNVITEHYRDHHKIKPFSHILMDLYNEVLPSKIKPFKACRKGNNASDENRIHSLKCGTQIPATHNHAEIFNSESEPICGRRTNIPYVHQNKRKPFRRNTMAAYDINMITELNLNKFNTLPNLRVNQNSDTLNRSKERLPTINKKTKGPEFVVNSNLSFETVDITDYKYPKQQRRTVSVLLLNGRNIQVLCNPHSTTARQVLESILKTERLTENFFLGLCALIGGDFVFLPSDFKIYKVAPPIWLSSCRKTNFADNFIFSLFIRIKFFLPSLHGFISPESHHLHYLQLRKSILERQILCSDDDLVLLGGLALQCEMGDFKQTMITTDYFIISHYLPEGIYLKNKTMESNLRNAHCSKQGLHSKEAEQSFVTFVQSMKEYGYHLFCAIWTTDNDDSSDVYLSISLGGIGMFNRSSSKDHSNDSKPHSKMKCDQRKLLVHYDWQEIENLSFTKQTFCMAVRKPENLKSKNCYKNKYKLKMDARRSYFAFTLASEHHQFYMKLRNCYASLKEISQNMNMALSPVRRTSLDRISMKYDIELNANAEHISFLPPTENIQEFHTQSLENVVTSRMRNKNQYMLNDILTNKPTFFKRSISSPITRYEKPFPCGTYCVEEYQNKENELPKSERFFNIINPKHESQNQLSPNRNRGVKMVTRAFSANFLKRNSNMYDHDIVDCQMHVFNANNIVQLSDSDNSDDELKLMNCGSASENPSDSPTMKYNPSDAYVMHSSLTSIERYTDNLSLLHQDETVSNTLLDHLNNLSGHSGTTDRLIAKITIKKDIVGNTNLSLHSHDVTTNKSLSRTTEKLVNCGKRIGPGGLTLGISIVQGTDNNVYVKDLLRHGPGELGGVHIGDQILAVNGVSLLNLPYRDSLKTLQTTGQIVELIVSQLQPSVRSCRQSTAKNVDYLKQIRNETNAICEVSNDNEKKCIPLDSNSDSSKDILTSNDQMVTKSMPNLQKAFDTYPRNCHEMHSSKMTAASALPRAVRNSRKYMGPIKYPVTPIRVTKGAEKKRLTLLIDREDDDQVFI